MRFGHTLIGSTFGNTNQRKPLKDDSMKKYKLQDAFFNEHMVGFFYFYLEINTADFLLNLLRGVGSGISYSACVTG